MKTYYEVHYRVTRLTKSGKPTKSARKYIARRKTFTNKERAEEFAKQYSGDWYTKIEPVQVDDTLLADIFHL